MAFFHSSPLSSSPAADSVHTDFSYLPPDAFYFDSACQTLRPQQVIDAETAYYHDYNACGGRVKYRWGQRVDDAVTQARLRILAFAGKSPKEYAVAFTLNTTYGINLVLHQLSPDGFKTVVTSDIEHNSVFLPTTTYAQRNGMTRTVLSRLDDGALDYRKEQLDRSIVVLNSASNIDGRRLLNAVQIADDVHSQGGLLLLDAAQTFGHGAGDLQSIDFDAAFGSGHKMYGPSIGFIIIKRSLLRTLQPYFIGGGTVQDSDLEHFKLLSAEEEHAVLEPGLQNWAGIIGLSAAIDWISTYKPDGTSPEQYERALSEQLFTGLKDIPSLTLINQAPTSTISFFTKDIDAHRIALYVDEAGIMCRSGSFCCHYYLQHLKKLPPLVRLSIGLHNTPSQVTHVVETLTKILRA